VEEEGLGSTIRKKKWGNGDKGKWVNRDKSVIFTKTVS